MTTGRQKMTDAWVKRKNWKQAPVTLEDGTVDDWERDLTEDEYLKRTRRAGGDCECDVCGRKYYDHPMEVRILGYDDQPFLHRICDGWLVKL